MIQMNPMGGKRARYSFRGFGRGILAPCVLGIVFASSVCAEPAAAPEETHGKTYAIETIRNVSYCEGPDADPFRHKLDLYLPKGQRDFPVLFFVHGGAWRHGNKDCFGLYSNFGKFCARHGVGAVLPNYRLSPAVAHPEHVQDVARAFQWTYNNIRKYQGSPEHIFVSGHSAGAHLIALLATDESFLKTEGLNLQAIKGAIPMSGVYRIPDHSRFFDEAFGNAVKDRRLASPLEHVKPGLPPFLIIYAESELPYCEKNVSEEFCKNLCAKNCAARTLEVKERNHITVILNAVTDADPAARAVLDFIDNPEGEKKK